MFFPKQFALLYSQHTYVVHPHADKKFFVYVCLPGKVDFATYYISVLMRAGGVLMQDNFILATHHMKI